MYNVTLWRVRLIFVPPDYPKSLISLHSKRQFFLTFLCRRQQQTLFSFEVSDAFSLFNQTLTSPIPNVKDIRPVRAVLIRVDRQ